MVEGTLTVASIRGRRRARSPSCGTRFIITVDVLEDIPLPEPLIVHALAVAGISESNQGHGEGFEQDVRAGQAWLGQVEGVA